MFKKNMGKKNLVGLDIGSSSVKAVELQRKGGTLQLVNLGFEKQSNADAIKRAPAKPEAVKLPGV